MTVPGALLSLLQACVDLVYPLRCAHCRRKITSSGGLPLCGDCFRLIRKNRPPFCRTCGRTIDSGPDSGLCSQCRSREKPFFDRAFSVFLYEGPVKALVHELKYRGKDHLGPLLGEQLAGFPVEYGVDLNFIDIVVPVPLHRAKLREREFNQALLLAREVARDLGKPLAEAALVRKRNTRTQTELPEEKRRRNVESSFAAGKIPVAGKNILLVDDVMTTGATVSDAARGLKEAGARTVFVLTLAS